MCPPVPSSVNHDICIYILQVLLYILDLEISIGLFLKMGYFIGCLIEYAWKTWPSKTDFGQPNAEIGWK